MPALPPRASTRSHLRHRRRSGRILSVTVPVVVLSLLAGMIWYFAFGDEESATAGPVLVPVKRGDYEFMVLEQGEVESSSNIELRCEVKTRGGGGSGGPSTTILEVVPEGTQVVPKGEKTEADQVEVGDVLVRLDSSALEQELVQQQIMVNTSEAIMLRAKNVYEAALITKREYLEGTFKQEEQIILNERYVAQENLRRAQETAKFSERLAARGYLTPLQLEGDLFAVEKYKNELAAAETKLRVLRDYTREKMLKQFDSDINSAEVDWRNQQDSNQLELQKLEEIKDQIKKCIITAPEPGTVVYANIVSSRGSSEFVVEAGAPVRERQVIIRLPDPEQMQVNAQIGESRITLVKPGMRASIRIDAVGDRQLRGEVARVNKYAEPSSWWSSNLKEYTTIIKILDPPANIRPGLTAEVSIHVDQRDDALQVPVQAVLDHQGRFYCVVKEDDQWQPRRITISSTNDRFVAIDEAASDPLNPDDMIVMNPRQFMEWIELPNLPPQPRVQLASETAAAVIQDSESGSSATDSDSENPSERENNDSFSDNADPTESSENISAQQQSDQALAREEVPAEPDSRQTQSSTAAAGGGE